MAYSPQEKAEIVTRLQPGVLGNDESALDESHSAGLLEHPHYKIGRAHV